MTTEQPQYEVIQRELNEVHSALERQDDQSFVVDWIRIQLGEMAAVLAHKSADLLKESRQSVEGLPRDQAKRYCSLQLQEGIVQLTSSAMWSKRSDSKKLYW